MTDGVAGKGALTILDSRVPPAVHEVDTRRFGQVKRDTSGLQANEEDGDMHIVHYG